MAAVIAFFVSHRIAKRLTAAFLVFLLVFTPFSPLVTLSVTPAQAGFDSCVSLVGDSAAFLDTLETDFANPMFPVCTGKIASADVLSIAILAIVTGIAATGAFTDGSGSAIDQCNDMIGKAIAKAIVVALDELYDVPGIPHDALNLMAGGDATKFFADLATDGSEEVMDFLQATPPFSVILSDLSCACELVGGAIDLAKDAVVLAKDTLKCTEAAWDAAKAVANAIESGVGDAVHLGECIMSDVTGGFIGDCPTHLEDNFCKGVSWEDDHASTNHDASWFSGMISCAPGSQCGTVPGNGLAPPNSDPNGSTLVNNGCVSCPTFAHAVGNATGGGEKGGGCGCDGNYTAQYNGANQLLSCQCEIGFQPVPGSTDNSVQCACAPGQILSSGYTPPTGGNQYGSYMTPKCTSCPSGEWSFDGKSCLSCPGDQLMTAGGCQACPDGTVASYQVPGSSNPSIVDYTNGHCDRVCPDGDTFVRYQLVVDQYIPVCEPTCGANTVTVSSADNPGGTCFACPAGSSSTAGATQCTPLSCTKTEKNDPNGGHSCVACDKTVLLTKDGSTVIQIGRGGSEGGKPPPPIPPGAYESCADPDRNQPNCAYGQKPSWDACVPDNCQGLDHPDPAFQGHQCTSCGAIVNLPVSILGGNAGGATTTPKADGTTTINLPGGKSVSLGSIQSKGSAKSVKVTDVHGKTQMVNVGPTLTKGATFAVCLDPDMDPAHQPPPYRPNLPGVELLEIPRNMHPTENDLRPGFVVPFGGDPGNYPIINGGGTAISVPAKLPTGPGRRPVRPGGTSSSLPGQSNPQGGNTSTAPAQGSGGTTTSSPGQAGGGTANSLPAQGSGGTAAPLPGQSEPTREPPRKPGEGGSSSALPAEGDGKKGPIGVGPARMPKGNDTGGFTTEIMQGQGNAPISTGPARSPKDKGNGGFTTFTMPAEGDASSKTEPHLRATPKLNEGPQLRTKPPLNGTQQLRMAPQTTPQGARAPSVPNNAQQPERTRPTLNGSSSSGPTLTPGGRNTNSSPFGR